MDAERVHTYCQNKYRLLAVNPNNIELDVHKNNDLFLPCNLGLNLVKYLMNIFILKGLGKFEHIKLKKSSGSKAYMIIILF